MYTTRSSHAHYNKTNKNPAVGSQSARLYRSVLGAWCFHLSPLSLFGRNGIVWHRSIRIYINASMLFTNFRICGKGGRAPYLPILPPPHWWVFYITSERPYCGDSGLETSQITRSSGVRSSLIQILFHLSSFCSRSPTRSVCGCSFPPIIAPGGFIFVSLN